MEEILQFFLHPRWCRSLPSAVSLFFLLSKWICSNRFTKPRRLKAMPPKMNIAFETQWLVLCGGKRPFGSCHVRLQLNVHHREKKKVPKIWIKLLDFGGGKKKKSTIPTKTKQNQVVVSTSLFLFSPRNMGKWSNFDEHIFFKGVVQNDQLEKKHIEFLCGIHFFCSIPSPRGMDPGSDLSAQSYGSLGCLMDGTGLVWFRGCDIYALEVLGQPPFSSPVGFRVSPSWNSRGFKIIIQKEPAFFKWWSTTSRVCHHSRKLTAQLTFWKMGWFLGKDSGFPFVGQKGLFSGTLLLFRDFVTKSF